MRHDIFQRISGPYPSILSEEHPLAKSLGVSFATHGEEIDTALKNKLLVQYAHIMKASKESFENFENSIKKRRMRVLATDDDLMSGEIKAYAERTEDPPEKRDTWSSHPRRTRAHALQTTVHRRHEHSQAQRLEKLNQQGLSSHVHHSKIEYSDIADK